MFSGPYIGFREGNHLLKLAMVGRWWAQKGDGNYKHQPPTSSEYLPQPSPFGLPVDAIFLEVVFQPSFFQEPAVRL